MGVTVKVKLMKGVVTQMMDGYRRKNGKVEIVARPGEKKQVAKWIATNVKHKAGLSDEKKFKASLLRLPIGTLLTLHWAVQ